jgi:hypothetical protein
LRAYAAPIDNPPSPNRVALTYQDGIALANNLDTETIYLQIVDASGNPIDYSRDIYVTVTDPGVNPATISAISAGTNNSSNALITTDANGLGYLQLIRNSDPALPNTQSFPVTLTAYWDGTGSSDSFGTATSGTIGVTFYEDPAPTLSSASNLSFTEGGTPTLPVLTVSDSGLNNITAANELYIRIPSSLNVIFNTAVIPTRGGANAARTTAASFPNNKTLLIPVSADFVVTDTLTLTGLQFNTPNTDSSGRLELSFDGGTTYPVVDDKLITINDAGNTYTWTGTVSTAWATAEIGRAHV